MMNEQDTVQKWIAARPTPDSGLGQRNCRSPFCCEMGDSTRDPMSRSGFRAKTQSFRTSTGCRCSVQTSRPQLLLPFASWRLGASSISAFGSNWILPPFIRVHWRNSGLAELVAQPVFRRARARRWCQMVPKSAKKCQTGASLGQEIQKTVRFRSVSVSFARPINRRPPTINHLSAS
jgi:hypothetical protein